MAGVSWSERLVEVIAFLEPGSYRYGSGCVVAGKTVLTAAHVIAGAQAVTVRDTGKRSYAAEVDPAFVGDPGGPGPDLALLQVSELPGDGYSPFGLGRVLRDSEVPMAVERCHAFGYPSFADYPAEVPSRDSVQATGVIAAGYKLPRGLLSLVVSIEPAPLSPGLAGAEKSPWSGMSGGPVVAEDRLVGVVTEHSLPEGSSALTVVPLTALDADPAHPLWGPGVPNPAEWWQRLGASDPACVQPVPAPTGTPVGAGERPSAYLSQVERIAPAELAGRAAELGELTEFCTAQDGKPYLWLRAPAWAGKSALLSWFVLHPPPGVRVISFFITARFASQDDRVAFADAVLEQTLALRGQAVPALLTESTRDAHMLTQLSEAAALCRARGERLVLVVDGLDEDRGAAGHSIAALLPARPVAGLRVMVASRPNPPLPADVRGDHPLHDAAAVQLLAPSPHAALTKAVTQQEVKRLLAGVPGDRDLLGLVAAAGGGLTARDLGELTGQQAWQVEDSLRATAGRTFVTRAGTWQDHETYVLGHEELQEDAVSLLGSKALGAYRQRLHEWADRYAAHGWPDDTPDFLLQGYFRLVQAADLLPRMVGLATDTSRQARMLARSGAESAAAADLTVTQDAILAADPPDLAAMAAVAVHRDVMIRRNRDISPELPALWARLGAYARAEALAQSIIDPEQRAAALESVAAVTAPAQAQAQEAGLASPQPTGGGPTEGAGPASEDPDDSLRNDVATLISTAWSVGGPDAVALLDAAQLTAYAVRDPDLRADLWNDIASARGAPSPGHSSPLGPSSALAWNDRDSPQVDDVVKHAVAAGDLNRARNIVMAYYRDSLPHEPLLDLVEDAARAGDYGRAQEITLLLSASYNQSAALERLVEMAAEAGLPTDAEEAARKLPLADIPAALVKAARAARDLGDTQHARELLTEVLGGKEYDAPPWQRGFADAVKLMAEIGDTDAAASAAAGAQLSDSERLRALLTIAQAAQKRGDHAHARALAASVLEETVARPSRISSRLVGDAAALLTELGESEQARTAVLTFTDPQVRGDALVKIAQAALEIGDPAAAEAALNPIAEPHARDGLLPSFIGAYLRAGDLAAATTVVQQIPDASSPADLIACAVRRALDEGSLDIAAALVQKAGDHDARVALRIEIAGAAVTSAAPAQVQVLLEAAETAARSAPDPAWRAEILAEAAWALFSGPYADQVGAFATAAEAAARAVPGAEARAAALANVAAVTAADGGWAHADEVFKEAARASQVPCSLAEQLAARAQAASARGQQRTARAQAAAAGRVARFITEPNNRIRAEQAHLAAAIHAGDFRRATAAAHAISHPDQRALALIDLAHALAASGQGQEAIDVALSIITRDRQGDALSEVARLTAARGDIRLAEKAARAITVRGGRSPALLSVAWEASRIGDLTRATQIVESIPDQRWRELGLYAIHVQHAAPSSPHKTQASPTRHETNNTTTNSGQRSQELLRRADAEPDYLAAARLLAEAMRAGPCTPAFGPLSRISPPAVLAASSALLALLQDHPW